MDISIELSKKLLGALSLTDLVTGQPVTGKFSNIKAVSSNPEFLTAVGDDSTESVQLTTVGEGAGKIDVNADCTYTNTLGDTITENLSIATVPFTVTAKKVADKVQLNLVLGDPTSI